MVRDNPDGTRRQIEFFTLAEEDDATQFIHRHNLREPVWNRTGNCTCEVCGQLYDAHRLAWPWMPLHRICNGEYVKL
jgi:hypothetical protein